MPEEQSLWGHITVSLVTRSLAGPVSRVQSAAVTGQPVPGGAAVPGAEVAGPEFWSPLLLSPPSGHVGSAGRLLPVPSGEPGSSHLGPAGRCVVLFCRLMEQEWLSPLLRLSDVACLLKSLHGGRGQAQRTRHAVTSGWGHLKVGGALADPQARVRRSAG